MVFKDHFSGHAALYARYRPDYPEALFDWLAEAAPGAELAWDCGAGSGQAAAQLATRFRRVIATDASAEQLRRAPARRGVEYRVEPAEQSSLDDTSADLVFVAQALHWFDLQGFYAEVRRTLRPGGVIAALTYGLLCIDDAVDPVIGRFYRDAVGPCWPPERLHVEQGYAQLPFPFPRIDAPRFTMHRRWHLDQLAGYLRSWSASQRYRAARGEDPVAAWMPAFEAAWGRDGEKDVRWPLVLLAGRVN